MKNNSQILFSALFWKTLIFFLSLDLGSKALMHKFFKYVICYDGEYCNLKSAFISSVIDGQLYFSHLKHGYHNMSDRIVDSGGFISLIFKLITFILNKININFDSPLFSVVFPLLFLLLILIMTTNNKQKTSMSLLYIASGMMIAGGLGNCIELYLFGWATDFIGIPENSFLDKIPFFGATAGIANFADFSLWIGQILLIISFFLVKDKKSN